MRILGLDYGSKRLGFALSDPDAIIASPHSVETYKDQREALNSVVRVVDETGAELLVIGLPVNMNGTHGPAVEGVLAFIEKLKQLLSIPIETYDERLSTKSAHDALIEAGTRRQKRKGLVDKIAAQIILQSYIDSKADPFPE